MKTGSDRVPTTRLMGEVATYLEAALAGRLTLLLRVAEREHAVLSRSLGQFAKHTARASARRVQPRFRG